MAELRAHGTPVTPSTFAEWKARFSAEMAQARARHAGEADRRDAGPSGKAFFRQLEARARALRPAPLFKPPCWQVSWGLGRVQAGQDVGDAEDAEYEPESEEGEEEVDLEEDDGWRPLLPCT